MYSIDLSNHEIAILTVTAAPQTHQDTLAAARDCLGEYVEAGILGVGVARMRDLGLIRQDSLTMRLARTPRGSEALTSNFERLRDFVDNLTLANAAREIAA